LSAVASVAKPTAVADSVQEDTFDAYPSGYALISAEACLDGTRLEASELRTVLAGEPADHKDLSRLLQAIPGVRVVGECRESEISSAIRESHPDLVVVDLDAQGQGRFWTGRSTDGGCPLVICVASDPQCAFRAFDMHAVDFLVRPVGEGRFRQALDRVRQEVRKHRYSSLAQQMLDILQQSPALERAGQLVFRSSGRLIFLDLDDIDWIEASANYVRLNADAESYLVRESIGRLSERLDRERFVRIHRSVIVNVRRIKELQSCNAGEYIAVLKSGKKLPCSRGFRGELERYISTCIQTANTRR